MDTVTFPETDIAAIASGYGFTGVTVRTVRDLDAVRAWIGGPRDLPAHRCQGPWRPAVVVARGGVPRALS